VNKTKEEYAMSRKSVNGLLQPTDGNANGDRYLGHFLQVSYIQEISHQRIFSKDRIDCEKTGDFRFFIPKKELLGDTSVKIEVFAPDGELLSSQSLSYGSLDASGHGDNEDDTSATLKIKVNPKVIQFGDPEPVAAIHQKITGKVIDISGEKKGVGVQIVIMAASDSQAIPASEDFQPIFTAVTDLHGAFFGKIDNKEHGKAYGVVSGLGDSPIMIPLVDGKIPKEVLLIADLSQLPDNIRPNMETPKLPDGMDLINNPSFSQDLGGKCIDFTVPNRALEEFSFYHTVRTTEPEIKGLTITGKESKNIKQELLQFSQEFFTITGRLNNSFKAMSIIPYTIEEGESQPPPTPPQEETSPAGDGNTTMNTRMFFATAGATPVSTYVVAQAPTYFLKIKSGLNNIRIKADEAFDLSKDLTFKYLVKFLAEQAKRKAKIKLLHQQLAAAYCGKYGVQEAQSYCESITRSDSLNRDTIESLQGHIHKYTKFLKPFGQLVSQTTTFLSDLDELMVQSYAAAELITIMQDRCSKLIRAVDKNTTESQDQEELLGYLRRLVRELAEANGQDSYNFEPCPPDDTNRTMGILCLIKQFDNIKETLRNKATFTLGDILLIRENYDTFIPSITSFQNLLTQFYKFYKSGSTFFISIEDDYFIEHYTEIQSSLSVLKRQVYRAINRVEDIEQAYITNHPGRQKLCAENSVDWDDTPTIYENTTIAHGHMLHFKQQWKADGYSLGDLLYSLPLAPCQEKQIAIVDWDRDEQSARIESQSSTESLRANISRDRDISEIINSSLRESSAGESENTTSSTSGGGGIAAGFTIGFFSIGGAGGVSHSGASSSSSASQNSARSLSGSSLNRLQDNISQSASSLRSQRGTVIQTVGQSETVRVQTEVVKNNNHCHAMTVEYFEVLKHYAIEQNLVDVQECLFVPLPMSHFDHQKVLRWHNTLRRSIRGRKLRRGFKAITRIANHYADSDLPVNTYADEPIQAFKGQFSISFDLTRPYIETIEDETKTETIYLKYHFPWFDRVWRIPIDVEVPLTDAEKDAIFEEQYAPEIVRKFIETIKITGISEDGSEHQLDLDYTQLSSYQKNAHIYVNVASNSIQTISRRQITHLRFRAHTSVKSTSKIVLRSAHLSYTTKHMSSYIIRNNRINNDIINSTKVKMSISSPPFFKFQTKTDAALQYTPLSRRELRNPRKEDREAAAALISFLNENLEMAHKAIWYQMDSSRLFGLLDGYIAPNSGGKSVASVVENKIMGIVGNNLVLKVVPGERLDPIYRNVEDLLSYYKPTTPPDPFRISVPTKGVYAESVMGKCNSCEEIDDAKHWRFGEAPCGSKPTSIAEVSTASRRSEPANMQTKDLPANIITMQNAPAAPDPTGLGAAFDLLGKNTFKDITGLAGTQANAIKALETTSKSVTDLAGLATDVQKQAAMKKDIGKTLKTIKEAEADEIISKDQANDLAVTALKSMVGEPSKKAPKLTQEKDIKELIKSQSKNKKAAIKVKRGSESVEVSPPKTGAPATTIDYTVPGLVPIIAQPSNMTCWATVATMMMSWHKQKSYTIQAAMDMAGATYRELFDNNGGLAGSDHEAFAIACGMKGEPSMSYTISGIQELIQSHGPLIVIGDEQPGENWAIHARIVRGIYGDGTVDGTFLRINDPAGGHQYNESFKAFAQKFEEMADAPRLQIMHF
jgi:hypothetical protein